MTEGFRRIVCRVAEGPGVRDSRSFKLRYLVIGMISGKHWKGVITYRGEKIRIISMRRPRKEEVEIYEG